MSQYPPASKRKYASTKEYRGYLICNLLAPAGQPFFTVDDAKIHEVWFILDDMGENALPADVPVSSFFQATAAVDMFFWLDSNELWKKQHLGRNSVWTYVHENLRMESKIGDVANFLREVEEMADNFDPDMDDAADMAIEIRNKIRTFRQHIPAWRKGAAIPDNS